MSGRIANIGARGRRNRLAVGVGALAMGLLVAVVLITQGLEAWWFAGVFVPFWIGAHGILQARAAT